MKEQEKLSYIVNAAAVPKSARRAWYKNTAPAYAGIILWFVFWQDIVNTGTSGGGLARGIFVPIIAVIIAALLCHFLFYLAPAQFGRKTGFGLAVLGSSLFGLKGGIFMPGLLMGLLQFGWLAVNIYFTSCLLHETLAFIPMWLLIVLEGAAATFIGLKGIKYVAGISTYFPIIPLAVLSLLLFRTAGAVGGFSAEIFGRGGMDSFEIFAFVLTYVIGFFATAGAAGADFGTCARDSRDVNLGGLVGVSLSAVLTGAAAVLIVAGAYGNPETARILAEAGNPMSATAVMNAALGPTLGKTCMFLLAVSAFPSACFASLIAANSFRTMIPSVNANLSVSVGGAAAIALAITGAAANAIGVFGFIGASFGPICGMFAAEYILKRGEWRLTDKNFNAVGWASWGVGFAVGVLPNFGIAVPAAPLLAFAAGFALYFALSRFCGVKISR